MTGLLWTGGLSTTGGLRERDRVLEGGGGAPTERSVFAEGRGSNNSIGVSMRTKTSLLTGAEEPKRLLTEEPEEEGEEDAAER